MRRRWLVLLLLIVGLAGGAFIGDRMLKKRDHPGLRTFIGQWWRNYPKSFKVDPTVINIKVDDKDLQQLESVVEESRARGVIMPDGNDYVKAEIGVEKDRFEAKVRIKGKLTDHVQGSKWSFRVIAKKDGGFMGMKRFSLQHPGTRNYLCDWFYHKLSTSEGIIALRYGFLKVKFNDDDLGVYAYEEHFGPELLEHNGRLPGPLFRFDPALFWEHRLNEMNKLRFDEPFAAFQAASVDAFGSSDLVKDEKMRAQFEEAVALLDAFRRGELGASEVFDADRIARRHAILDLIGGHHSMDWSDVKFYYDPVLKRVEPVSYESFSAFPLRALAGSNMFIGRNDASMDLHERYFNDENIFRAYVRHLERMSRNSWLDSTFAVMAPALDTASAILYGEFPYKELDRSIYYKNQQVIRKLLNGPKPFHAFVEDTAHSVVRVTVLPIEGLPMEVFSLVLPDGRHVPPMAGRIVPCRKPGKLGQPIELRFETNIASLEGMTVECSVLGASVKREVEVFPYALRNGLDVKMGTGDQVDAHLLPFFKFDEDAKTITVLPGAWTLDKTVVLPGDYRCLAIAPLKLNIINGAELISRSPLLWKGEEEMPIEIFSSDSSSHGVHVVGADGMSRLSNVTFSNLSRYKYDQERSGDVTFYQSNATIDHCIFRGTGATLLDASVGTITISGSRFIGASDQLETHYAQVKLDGVRFERAKDDAISVEGGEAKLSKIDIDRIGGVGVKATKLAKVEAQGLSIHDAKTACEGREAAHVHISGSRVDDVELISLAKKREMRYGPVVIELDKVDVKGVKAEHDCGEGSTVKVDGNKVAEEKTAKKDKKK
ncbi:MAG TPA: right-handed parallel beta-helix repeat-containing protein [Flavobacteriales bacterium]|nr:right-handed parallel beta-helix repeat-containing protein [Flavobacteriales bacterium]